MAHTHALLAASAFALAGLFSTSADAYVAVTVAPVAVAIGPPVVYVAPPPPPPPPVYVAPVYAPYPYRTVVYHRPPPQVVYAAPVYCDHPGHRGRGHRHHRHR